MFELGLSEMMLIGVIALVVLGPERLPKVARTVGRLIGKVQSFVNTVKYELTTQADLTDLKQAKSSLEQAAGQFRDEIRGLDSAALGRGEDNVRPAWERLPEQHKPEDFGVDEYGKTLERHKEGLSGFQVASLRQQAMRRKRDMRPRHLPQPRLRSRKVRL
ncbi:MAG: Sec-independent protein translocase protein TatB [Neisseria sp.]